LVAFQKKHGPISTRAGEKRWRSERTGARSKLKTWVNTSRTTEKAGKMDPKRRALMDSIGFWDNHKPIEDANGEDEANRHKDDSIPMRMKRCTKATRPARVQKAPVYPVVARYFKRWQRIFFDNGSHYHIFFKKGPNEEQLTEQDPDECRFIIPE
jgi:hypothetical protein